MASSDFLDIFRVLETAKVRYLVVGGVAVVLHGHPRFTADLDLVVHLQADNVRSAIAALAELGYQPRPPVNALDLANESVRCRWIAEKGLTVLSFWSSRFPATEIDIFVDEPFDFDATYERAVRVDLGGVETCVCALDDLVAMKRAAGRARDLEDALALETIRDEDADEPL